MDRPPSLLNLPPELRLMIYRQVLVTNEICINSEGSVGKDHLGLLLTCKLIYRESIRIVHKEVCLRIVSAGGNRPDRRTEPVRDSLQEYRPWNPNSSCPRLLLNFTNLSFFVDGQDFPFLRQMTGPPWTHWEVPMLGRMTALKCLRVIVFTNTEGATPTPALNRRWRFLFEVGIGCILMTVPEDCKVVWGLKEDQLSPRPCYAGIFFEAFRDAYM